MITLERFAYTDNGTFGKLSFDDFSCFTVEKSWENNNPYDSCIPEGEYTLVHYTSPKFGKVFAVIGGTVSLYQDPNHTRFAVLIHPANVAADVEGCIGLGDSMGMLKGSQAVLNSVITLKEFMAKVGPYDNIPFTITYNKKDISSQ